MASREKDLGELLELFHKITRHRLAEAKKAQEASGGQDVDALVEFAYQDGASHIVSELRWFMSYRPEKREGYLEVERRAASAIPKSTEAPWVVRP